MTIDETYKDLAFLLLLFIFVGMFGNLMSVQIFGKKSMKKYSTFRFLLYQSIIDLLVLSICASDTVLTYGFNVEVRLVSSLICKIHTFLTFFLTQLSSTILMFVSIERVLVVCQFKSISSTKQNIQLKRFEKNRIEKLVAIITAIIFSINIHYLFFYKLNKFNGNLNNQDSSNLNISAIKNIKLEMSNLVNSDPIIYSKINVSLKSNSENTDSLFYICYSSNPYYDYFLRKMWTHIDNLIYSLIPITIMTFCSIMIFFHIREKSKRFFRISAKLNKTIIQNRMKRNKQILYMLIATNLYFVICSLPYCMMSFKASKSNSSSRFSQPMLLAHIMSYSNNSFNFVYYMIFVKQYRDSALKIFGLKVDEKDLLNDEKAFLKTNNNNQFQRTERANSRKRGRLSKRTNYLSINHSELKPNDLTTVKTYSS